MSLDKAIEYGKEKRKPYYGSKAIDRTCRNHGDCPVCQGNRQHKHKKKLEKFGKLGKKISRSEAIKICEQIMEDAERERSEMI